MQKITTPNGETLVVLPLADYEHLVDAADIAHADRIVSDIATGRDERVPSEVVKALIAGENPIRVWRKHRGLSGRDLAERAGLSAAYISELESGKKDGSVSALKAIAVSMGLELDEVI